MTTLAKFLQDKYTKTDISPKKKKELIIHIPLLELTNFFILAINFHSSGFDKS